MAIVFVSPKQRQRMFLTGILGGFLIIVLIFSLAVLFSKPNRVPEQLVFNRPKIDIDLKVLDSEVIKMFQPAGQMDLQFKYEAATKKGVKKSGIVTAASQEAALELLEGLDLINIKIEKAEAGRENPFAPY